MSKWFASLSTPEYHLGTVSFMIALEEVYTESPAVKLAEMRNIVMLPDPVFTSFVPTAVISVLFFKWVVPCVVMSVPEMAVTFNSTHSVLLASTM